MPVPDPARNKKMPAISSNVFSLHKIYLSSAFSLYSLKYSIYIIRFPSYDYLKLFLFSLPCSQLILSTHMHRFLESSACRSSELHQPAVQPEYKMQSSGRLSATSNEKSYHYFLLHFYRIKL